MSAKTHQHGLGDVFATCRAQGRAALIGWLPVGYPDKDTSIKAMVTLVENGADIIEIGIPYSDPVIDGPTNQLVGAAALAGGFRVDDTFDAVRAVREAGAVPIVMSYWNPILRRGVEEFAAELAAAGGAGVVTPDLTPDEGADWIAASDRHGLDRIFLAAPSSTPERLKVVTDAATGFVYAASTMGVTGARTSVGSGAQDLVDRLRAVTDTPVCVGLGVSSRAQAAQVAAYADGVIVGSALVSTLIETEPVAGLTALAGLTRELAAGVREG